MPNALKTTLLLGALSGLLLVVGEVVGGANGLMIALIFAAIMNIGSYWFSDKIVLRMYGAQAVGPDHPLSRMTQRLAQQADLPMPRVFIIPDASPNAFATGRDPQHAAVAATEGIMRLLTEHELEGVIAHELAHVKHRDTLTSTIAATLAAAIIGIGRMAICPRCSAAATITEEQPDGPARDDDPRRSARVADQTWISRTRSSRPTRAVHALPARPTASRTRCVRSTRQRSVCRSTPTRPRHTSSSCSRSSAVG